MIGKGKAIAHTQASMAYGLKEEKQAEVVYSQYLAGERPKEITQEFSILQQQNERCRNNTLSFVVSPTIKDGKYLNNDDLKEITERFLKGSEVHRSMSMGRIAEQMKFDRAVTQKAFKENAINVLNRRLKVSPDLATKMACKVAIQVIKKTIDKGRGIGLEI